MRERTNGTDMILDRERETKMKGNSHKKKALAITLIILVLAIIAGTFMWFTSHDSVTNEMALDRFDVTITEKFDPNTPVEPGKTIDKEVGVSNNSNIPAIARVMLKEEIWLTTIDSDQKVKIDYNSDPLVIPADGVIVKVHPDKILALAASGYTEVTDPSISVPTGVKLFSRTVPKDDGTGTTTEYFAYVVDSSRLAKFDPTTSEFSYAYFQREMEYDGIHQKTGADLDPAEHKYVTPNLINLGNNTSATPGWVLDPATGWYYWNQAIPAGSNALPLLASITFAEDMPNRWQGAKYVVTPVMEATQYNVGAFSEWTDVMSGLHIWNGTDSITAP